MQIIRAVIHNVLKTQGQIGATVELSESLLPIDESAEELVEKLTQVYRTKNTTYAVFDEAEGKAFPMRFSGFAAQPTDDSFLGFSRDTAIALRETLHGLAPARGGYLLFAHYGVQGKEYTSVFLIRNTTGVFFNHDPQAHRFTINPTVHIDLDKLAMACRINMGMHAERTGKYLNFIKYNVKELSAYFTSWIAAVEREDSTTYTQALYDITRNIELPRDENGTEISRDELRKRIYTYADAQPARIINIRNLSETLYGNPDVISRYAEANDIVIDVEFKADSRQIKRFVKIDIRADGIVMQFSEGDLGTRIRPMEGSQNLVVVESETFAQRLREEINVRR